MVERTAQAGVRFQEYTVFRRRRVLPRQQGERIFPFEELGSGRRSQGTAGNSNPAPRRARELVEVVVVVWVVDGKICMRVFAFL